jgi:dolichyl-phosphate beta-glucosyltransferase
MRSPYLSVVIPAYNEEDIIEKNLKKIIRFLSKKKYSWEIVVVDDGSHDNTTKIIKKMKNKKIRIARLSKNVGKGGALKKGVLSAKGKYIVFTDADLSVPISYLDKLLPALKKHEVVIASRRIEGARLAKRQPFVRELMGKGFTKITQIVIGSGIADFTCGFKGFQNKAAKKIFKKSNITRWAYDAEIIFLATIYSYSIHETPIVWENREESRVKMGEAALESLRDLCKIRYYHLTGRYE